MKISTLSALYARYPLEKVFEIVSSQGYDGLELWGGRPHAFPRDVLRSGGEDILRWKEQYGLDIPMYSPGLMGYPFNVTSQDTLEREETVQHLLQGLDAAKLLGCPRVLVNCTHSIWGCTRAQSNENIRRSLAPIVEHAEKIGVDIVVELLTPMESNIVYRLYEIVDLLEYFDSPRLKTMLDNATPMCAWEPYSEHFETLGEKIDFIHFVDVNGINQSHRPLGTGILDLPTLLRIHRRYGYDGWYGLEILVAGEQEPELCSAREIRVFRALLREVEEENV